MALYTNKSGLPEVIYKLLARPQRPRGSDFSVTELLMPPQVVQLLRRHEGEVERDVAEMVNMLLGTAIHGVLEDAAKKNQQGIAEEYIKATFTVAGKKVTVGARLDFMEWAELDGQPALDITDWKSASVWSYIYEKATGGVKPDYIEQVNVYDLLVRRELGIPVRNLSIGMFFKDWSKSKLRENVDSGKGDYPPAPILLLPVKRWTPEEQEAFVKERLRLHLEASHAAKDENLPECSAEERWAKAESFAVTKKGAVKAMRLLPTREEATELAKQAGPAYFVQHRPAVSTRCVDYCDARPFCAQWKRMEGGKQKEVTA